MKILLIEICCRWCKTTFCLCRSCYHGHVYCSDACRKAGRRQSLNAAQRRYRQTLKGKRTHCESENRRRHGKNYPFVKNMDDHTTSPNQIMPLIDVSEPLLSRKCHLCGRKGEVVPAFPRREYG